MSEDENREIIRPSAEIIEQELKRREERKSFRKALIDILRVLVVVAAVAVLISTMWIPVFQIYGSSMSPNLNDGDIVVAVKSGKFATGEIAAFYFNNNILMKRVIAHGGDTVDIKEDGSVYVNGERLDEPYVSELSMGQCDIEFPYSVPPGRYFVMGDQREISVDSRSYIVGAISEEQIVGKVIFKVWPLSSFGIIG